MAVTRRLNSIRYETLRAQQPDLTQPPLRLIIKHTKQKLINLARNLLDDLPDRENKPKKRVTTPPP